MSSQKNPIQIALVPSSTKRTPPQAQGRPSNTRGNLIQSGLATASTTTRATHQAQGNPTTTGGMNAQNGLVPAELKSMREAALVEKISRGKGLRQYYYFVNFVISLLSNLWCISMEGDEELRHRQSRVKDLPVPEFGSLQAWEARASALFVRLMAISILEILKFRS
ncbi:hypothetical protein Fmac_004936 [Flemingia macrophylla]|uniref:Uncharacterized protein n=1 Tax=Flemingia macrophylla TaxID=520843 RepID=A0ABD1N6X6_9FABA